MISLCLPMIGLASLTSFASANFIPSPFIDSTYRIERGFIAPDTAQQLFSDLLHKSLPGAVSSDASFPQGAVKLIGDAGLKAEDQPLAENYSEVLRQFSDDDYHQNSDAKKESLVYYIEQIDGEPLERSKELINNVTPNSVLEDGGTVHLYMSSPEAAALDNHTDTTDIVVIHLEGEKQWLVCSDPSANGQGQEPHQSTTTSSVRGGGQDVAMSRKLDSCSTYSDFEIDNLDCRRTILRPGDALFLPRRTVHSARALSDKFSAHLTFGFNEDTMCWDYQQTKQNGERMLQKPGEPGADIPGAVCSLSCNAGCDEFCNRSCDRRRFFSCDSGCKTGCDESCDLCL